MKSVEDGSRVGLINLGSSPILIFLFTAIAILGSVHSLSYIGIEIYRIMDRTAMIRSLESELAELKFEELSLKAVIDNQSDGLYHEQLARCIGYAYPNEDRFVTINGGAQSPKLANCQ